MQDYFLHITFFKIHWSIFLIETKLSRRFTFYLIQSQTTIRWTFFNYESFNGTAFQQAYPTTIFKFCWSDFFSITHLPLDKCFVKEFLKANLCPQCLHVCFLEMSWGSRISNWAPESAGLELEFSITCPADGVVWAVLSTNESEGFDASDQSQVKKQSAPSTVPVDSGVNCGELLSKIPELSK